MAKQVYCVLKGRPTAMALDDDASPHVEIKVRAGGASYRVAVNARSGHPPHHLLYARIDPFEHRITRLLPHAKEGVTEISGKLKALALDYVRGGLVRRRQMRVAPFEADGPHNDLREFLGVALRRAIKSKGAMLYAYGESWGPEPGRPDFYFGFDPGQGVHDIHMNQGSKGRHRSKNRPRQDGGLLIHYPREGRWIGLFLAFQTQSWRTEFKTGHPRR